MINFVKSDKHYFSETNFLTANSAYLGRMLTSLRFVCKGNVSKSPRRRIKELCWSVLCLAFTKPLTLSRTARSQEFSRQTVQNLSNWLTQYITVINVIHSWTQLALFADESTWPQSLKREKKNVPVKGFQIAWEMLRSLKCVTNNMPVTFPCFHIAQIKLYFANEIDKSMKSYGRIKIKINTQELSKHGWKYCIMWNYVTDIV